MKDLSRLNIPQKPKDSLGQTQKPITSNTRRKKIIVLAIVSLLSIAVASKIINKHLKKQKNQEETQIETNTTVQQKQKDTNEQVDSKRKTNLKNDNNDMVFTFYDNLKNESVVIDAKPQAQRAQYNYTYVYQIASFRNMNETTYYVKKMKEAGLEPKFEHVGNWIRMYIGPYNSTRAMAPDIIKLQRIGLNGGFTREISKTKIELKEDDSNKSKETTKEPS
ncbi:SPOR domain-containing protein [Allofrancisella guangzhouensis]|uniref:Cell division protein n=1 Tax=Allofrancisella guangzhouensis TaxID=594679 RepID=A0A0A8E425_9GAMM|nr:SPOR domain-containing protein [Allofrancisella guangzhouensis]AJC48689.1 cell division protein [Allofrancisella guangzhouensis]MBK2027919.1 SPOR domain-containing protein [Allofrancisella guangzhouensis]MBK2043970.1 SPOR domain-containing protein [Allofrancisella guangzhouensis]MBK2046369.1 SPOR domain-containing protein [Allofrancisella guangzhouensis]